MLASPTSALLSYTLIIATPQRNGTWNSMSEVRNETSEPEKSRYLVGIDLGTTNCALAYFDTLDKDQGIQSLRITQWESEDLLTDSAVLPSFCYLLPKPEIKRRRYTLPWHKDEDSPEEVVGQMAARLATTSPGRVIHSAKSWLCHRSVDREERILPWNSDEIIGTKRRSPVETSAIFLRHLKDCWNSKIAPHQTQYRLENQQVTITVPASFDESAQRLTLAAAELAGFRCANLRLLEEPQAAFYHLLEGMEESGSMVAGLTGLLPGIIDSAKTVLICDIGGGTTDFSLFRVDKLDPSTKSPGIQRIAVSDHILLGGDNIDLKIAAVLEEKFQKKYGNTISSSQWAFMMNQSRTIKERALAAGDDKAENEAFMVSLPGTGSGLFSSALTVEIAKQEIAAMVTEGFYPECSPTEAPAVERSALQEWNLPYAADTGITRHLANFLNGRTVDAVLYTGGSLKPQFLQNRLTRLIESWQARTVTVLINNDLDLAVARGSASFAKSIGDGKALIRGGYPRSLFVEINNRGTPGLLCVLPKGFDSTQTVEISSLDLKVRIGEPVAFNLFSATRRDGDIAGGIVAGEFQNMMPLPSLQTRLEPKLNATARKQIKVGLRVRVEPTGLLAISCFDKESEDSWSLEFNLRDKVSSEAFSTEAQRSEGQFSPDLLTRAYGAIDTYYGKKKSIDGGEKSPGQLVQQLESTLQCERAQWELSTLRLLWPSLKDGLHRRGRSASHEATWLNLAGFVLRPGYGTDLDRYRIADLWPIFQLGPVHGDESRIKNQWWILWRRVAGGLTKMQHETLFAKIMPAIKKGSEATAEMYMLAGALELVDMEKKIQLGNMLVEQIVSGKHHCIDQKIWALSRLASRVPMSSGAESVIRPSFVEAWSREFLNLDCHKLPLKRLAVFFALAGRMVMDREFDISAKARANFLTKLRECQASPEQLRLVAEFVPQSLESKSELFGEALPVGFVIS
jgi:molecular chaperone DnaK (HSP70)